MLLPWVWPVWPLNRIRRLNVIKQGAQRVLCLVLVKFPPYQYYCMKPSISIRRKIDTIYSFCREIMPVIFTWMWRSCITHTGERRLFLVLSHTLVNTDYGLVLVLALPLGVAVERSVHNFWNHFSFSSVSHTFLPEGVVIGLWNFARSLKSQKNKIGGKNKLRNPPTPCFFGLKVIFFWCAWEAHLNVPLSRAQHNCNWMI